MQDITVVLSTYFRAWNEPGRTRDRIGESCAPDIHYVDPRNVCRSADELAARIDRGHAQAPRSRVRFASVVDGYGDTFRYTWVFEAPEMKLVLPGWDVVVQGGDGRIVRLTSFFGELAALEPGAALRRQPEWSA